MGRTVAPKKKSKDKNAPKKKEKPKPGKKKSSGDVVKSINIKMVDDPDSLNIRVFKNMRITGDSRQFRLEQRRTSKKEGGTPTWKVIGYFYSLGHCLQSAVQAKLKEGQKMTLQEALDKYKKLTTRFIKMIKKAGLV